jgi:hypothetical protein
MFAPRPRGGGADPPRQAMDLVAPSHPGVEPAGLDAALWAKPAAPRARAVPAVFSVQAPKAAPAAKAEARAAEAWEAKVRAWANARASTTPTAPPLASAPAGASVRLAVRLGSNAGEGAAAGGEEAPRHHGQALLLRRPVSAAATALWLVLARLPPSQDLALVSPGALREGVFALPGSAAQDSVCAVTVGLAGVGEDVHVEVLDETRAGKYVPYCPPPAAALLLVPTHAASWCNCRRATTLSFVVPTADVSKVEVFVNDRRVGLPLLPG